MTATVLKRGTELLIDAVLRNALMMNRKVAEWELKCYEDRSQPHPT